MPPLDSIGQACTLTPESLAGSTVLQRFSERAWVGDHVRLPFKKAVLDAWQKHGAHQESFHNMDLDISIEICKACDLLLSTPWLEHLSTNPMMLLCQWHDCCAARMRSQLDAASTHLRLSFAAKLACLHAEVHSHDMHCKCHVMLTVQQRERFATSQPLTRLSQLSQQGLCLQVADYM